MEENALLSKNKFKSIIYKYCIYFVFYSFIGYLLETIFGIFSKGVLESRQSFLFGPFCAIYGIGAILMIITLNRFKDKPVLLFFLGAIVGSIAEYGMSFICEKVFHFIWWDYSDYFFNINGRVCLYFSLMWGALAIILIRYVNPFFNKVLLKIANQKHYNLIKGLFKLLMIFLIFDIIATIVALRIFYLQIDKDFNVSNSKKYVVARTSYEKTVNENFEESMLLTYPNIRVVDYQQKVHFVDSFYKNMRTYYIKLFNK
ncbi:MAG: putative ABC transporter permease [Candidatus Scatovivens sp.]